MTTATYTTQLQAGLGMLDETRELLDLWQPTDSTPSLYQRALDSGRFPTLSARRLRNIVAECFAPRFLSGDPAPAGFLKSIVDAITSNEFRQICLIHTCRANAIVGDFIRNVYWESYAAGRSTVAKQQAQEFVDTANRDGHTANPWSETTKKRVAGYLTGTLADFGMLEPAARADRAIVPFRMESRVAGLLAYDLHFSGLSDSRVVSSDEWSLFGLDRPEVIDSLKKLSVQNWLVYQSAASSVRLGWHYSNQEALADAISTRQL